MALDLGKEEEFSREAEGALAGRTGVLAGLTGVLASLIGVLAGLLTAPGLVRAIASLHTACCRCLHLDLGSCAAALR